MRRKNRVEKPPQDSSAFDAFWAANLGRKGLAAKQYLGHVKSLQMALDLAGSKTGGPLLRAFRKHGWSVLLAPCASPNKWDKSFYGDAGIAVAKIMELLSEAIRSGDARELRKVCDLIETPNPKDPVDVALLNCKLFNLTDPTDTYCQQIRFPTAREIYSDVTAKHPNSTTIKTIRNRAKILGVILRKDRKGPRVN